MPSTLPLGKSPGRLVDTRPAPPHHAPASSRHGPTPVPNLPTHVRLPPESPLNPSQAKEIVLSSAAVGDGSYRGPTRTVVGVGHRPGSRSVRGRPATAGMGRCDRIPEAYETALAATQCRAALCPGRVVNIIRLDARCTGSVLSTSNDIKRGAEGSGPTTRPATWLSRQGANASPATGTIRLAPSNQRREAPHPRGLLLCPTGPMARTLPAPGGAHAAAEVEAHVLEEWIALLDGYTDVRGVSAAWRV